MVQATDSTLVTGPLRTCVGCRQRHVVTELFRLWLNPEGELQWGHAGPARGVWLCQDSLECWNRALRIGAITRALRRTPESTSLEAFVKAVEGSEGHTPRPS